MSEFDRRITDPHYDAPFLEWYSGIFDAVYIALHPFYKLDDIDPATAPRPVLVVDRQTLGQEVLTRQVIEDLSRQAADRCSMDLQTLQICEKRAGQGVSWEYVRAGCGFQSIAKVNQALLTIIMAIRGDNADTAAAEHLQAYCTGNQIFLPTEDTFPPLLESTITAVLERTGFERITLADEFNEPMVTLRPQSLQTELPWAYCGLLDGRGRPNKIYPEDHSFLMVAPWDNFYTAICGDRLQLKAWNIEALFEGFWCDHQTQPNWWC